MLSIIIPTKNEEENVRLLERSLVSVFRSADISDYEIIFIDDCSTDNTLCLLREIARRNSRIRLFKKRQNQKGVGISIRIGLNCANGDFIIMMDADFSHDPLDIPKLLNAMNRNVDLVIGSRYIEQSNYNMPSPRNTLSKIFNSFLKRIFRISISDITSGFRIIRRKKLAKLRIVSEHFEIHPEINIKAALSGFKIREIPITFNRRRFGKSKLKYRQVILKYLQLIFEILRKNKS